MTEEPHMDFDQIIQQIIRPKKKIIVDNFRISEGILTCDNYFVPVEAISMVRLDDKQKRSYARAVFLIVIGIILALIPVIRAFGSLFIFFGFIDLIISLINNLSKIKYLRIVLNNGNVCSFENKNKKFLLEAMSVLEDNITGIRTTAVNVDFSNGTINYMNDNSIGKTTVGNISAGGNIDLGAGIGNSTNTVTVSVDELSDKEWEILENFFSQKSERYESGSSNNRAYEGMKDMAKNHNKDGLKKVLKSISKKFGEKTMTVLLSGAGKTVAEQVMPVIKKLLS